jgi:outer membrane biosynthesis protein TonB
MNFSMKRGATFSVLLHLTVLLALIVVIPTPPPPAPPPDDTMEVEFEGTAASVQKSQDHGHVAAPAESDQPADDNPALEKPKVAPLEHAPPPPPPPPPPAQSAPSQVVTIRPDKLPPPPPDREAEALKPPPPMKVTAPPPPKVVPTKTPVQKPSREPTAAKPMDTVRYQQQDTKNPAPDTHSLLKTLEQFNQETTKTTPPKYRYNPPRGGAKDAGGQTHGNPNGALTLGQAKTIGAFVKRCFSSEVEAKDLASYSVMLEVVVDQTGEVHEAHLAPESQPRAAQDPAYLAFSDAAIHAVLDPQCAKLPLPPNVLKQAATTLTFRFRP